MGDLLRGPTGPRRPRRHPAVDLHRDPGWSGARDPRDPSRHRFDLAHYHHRRGGSQEPARLPGDRSVATHRHFRG